MSIWNVHNSAFMAFNHQSRGYKYTRIQNKMVQWLLDSVQEKKLSPRKYPGIPEKMKGCLHVHDTFVTQFKNESCYTVIYYLPDWLQSLMTQGSSSLRPVKYPSTTLKNIVQTCIYMTGLTFDFLHIAKPPFECVKYCVSSSGSKKLCA